jgi:hypothetical protein
MNLRIEIVLEEQHSLIDLEHEVNEDGELRM